MASGPAASAPIARIGPPGVRRHQEPVGLWASPSAQSLEPRTARVDHGIRVGGFEHVFVFARDDVVEVDEQPRRAVFFAVVAQQPVLGSGVAATPNVARCTKLKCALSKLFSSTRSGLVPHGS